VFGDCVEVAVASETSVSTHKPARWPSPKALYLRYNTHLTRSQVKGAKMCQLDLSCPFVRPPVWM